MFLIWFLIFALSLYVLIKAADYFTEAAEKIGLALKLSPFVLGVTIVSLGTAMPELSTSLIAALKNNQTDLVAANALGSNIANILLVIGLAALVAKKINIKKNIINVDLPLLAIATTLLIVVIWDRVVNQGEAIILILGYIVYLSFILKTHKLEKRKPEGILPGEEIPATREQRFYFLKKDRPINLAFILIFLASILAIYFGAEWCVKSIINIASVLQVDSSVIAMLALAVGTSLPELVVALTAIKKGRHELALGNIFGANIFNSLMVIGIPALFINLRVDTPTFSIGVPFLIGAFLLYFFASFDSKITKFEGMMYLLVYAAFVTKLIGLF